MFDSRRLKREEPVKFKPNKKLETIIFLMGSVVRGKL